MIEVAGSPMFAKALPSFFTIGNLFIGIVAVILSIQGSLQYAAIMVIIGMLLDGLDGRVARMLNTQSEFGKELDSLSDVVTFGVAPAIIMYVSVLKGMEPQALGWLVTAIFPACGALRLARFNVISGSPGYFVGLPITAAGGILATMVVFKSEIHNPYIFLFAMLLLSYLMVSRVRYPAFKKMSIPRSAYFFGPLFVIAAAISAVKYPDALPTVIFVPLAFYGLYGMMRMFDRRRNREEEHEELDESEELAEELK